MAKIIVEGSNFNIKTSGNTLEITFDTIEKAVKETVERKKCGCTSWGGDPGRFFNEMKVHLKNKHFHLAKELVNYLGTEVIHENEDEIMKTALRNNDLETVKTLWSYDPVKKNWKGIVKELMTVNDEIVNFMYKVMCNDEDEGECIGRAFNACWGKGFEKKPVKKPDEPAPIYDHIKFRRQLKNYLERGDLHHAKQMVVTKQTFWIARGYLKELANSLTFGECHIAFRNFLNAVSKKYKVA